MATTKTTTMPLYARETTQSLLTAAKWLFLYPSLSLTHSLGATVGSNTRHGSLVTKLLEQFISRPGR